MAKNSRIRDAKKHKKTRFWDSFKTPQRFRDWNKKSRDPGFSGYPSPPLQVEVIEPYVMWSWFAQNSPFNNAQRVTICIRTLNWKHYFYENHQTVEWVSIFLRRPFPFFAYDLPTFSFNFAYSQLITTRKKCGQASKRKWKWLIYKNFNSFHSLVIFVEKVKC